MDVTCKCGHDANIHLLYHDDGCGLIGCDCVLSQIEVLEIYITEQQARLDTNRAQVGAMSDKIKRLENYLQQALDNIYRYDRITQALKIKENMARENL